MYTLVVVDMQPGFGSAHGDRVRKNCLREVMQAISDNAPIVFLEFFGFDKTLEELMPPTLNNYYVKTKHIDDGSDQVMSVVRKHNLPMHFKVCGINTDCCVRSTVFGLAQRIPLGKTITVIADACDSDWDHNGGLKVMRHSNYDSIAVV